MTIEFQDINERLRKVTISGRLDVQGTDEISNRFAGLTATSDRHILLDLSAVTFLASIGIRSIIANAKALRLRGGRMVLFVGDNAAVAKTLVTTGVDTLMPMLTDLAAAEQSLGD